MEYNNEENSPISFVSSNLTDKIDESFSPKKFGIMNNPFIIRKNKNLKILKMEKEK
jgi:hypothetical protein